MKHSDTIKRIIAIILYTLLAFFGAGHLSWAKEIDEFCLKQMTPHDSIPRELVRDLAKAFVDASYSANSGLGDLPAIETKVNLVLDQYEKLDPHMRQKFAETASGHILSKNLQLRQPDEPKRYEAIRLIKESIARINNYGRRTNICRKPKSVLIAIENAVGKDCAEITFEDLAKIKRLAIRDVREDLNEDSFYGLHQLVELVIYDSLSFVIHSNALDLPNLKELHLEGIKLKELTAQHLSHVPELEVLSYSVAARADLPNDLFIHNRKLRKLILSGLSNRKLSPEMLSPLEQLEEFYIAGSDRVTIPENMFTTNKNLKVLDSSHNQALDFNFKNMTPLPRLAIFKVTIKDVRRYALPGYEDFRALPDGASVYLHSSFIHTKESEFLQLKSELLKKRNIQLVTVQ